MVFQKYLDRAIVDIHSLGEELSGRNVDVHDGPGLVTIDGRVGLGELDVERVG